VFVRQDTIIIYFYFALYRYSTWYREVDYCRIRNIAASLKLPVRAPTRTGKEDALLLVECFLVFRYLVAEFWQ